MKARCVMRNVADVLLQDVVNQASRLQVMMRSRGHQKKDYAPKKRYCREHYLELFASKCATCNKPIPTGGKLIRGVNYHRECVRCHTCSTALDKEIYIKDGTTGVSQILLCRTHYVETRPSSSSSAALPSNHCGTCGKLVSEGGFIIKNRAYHSHCMKCGMCGATLRAGQAKTPEEEKISGIFTAPEGTPPDAKKDILYCNADYTRTFIPRAGAPARPSPKGPAPKRPTQGPSSPPGGGGSARNCPMCGLPIGQGAIVQTEEYGYHGDCFKCTKCHESVLNGYLRTSNGKLYCKKDFPKD